MAKKESSENSVNVALQELMGMEDSRQQKEEAERKRREEEERKRREEEQARIAAEKATRDEEERKAREAEERRLRIKLDAEHQARLAVHDKQLQHEQVLKKIEAEKAGIPKWVFAVIAGVVLIGVGVTIYIVKKNNEEKAQIAAAAEIEKQALAKKAEEDQRRANAIAVEAQRKAEEAAQAAKKLAGTLAEKEAVETARRLAVEADAARKSAAKKGGGGGGGGGGKKGGKISDDPLGGIDL